MIDEMILSIISFFFYKFLKYGICLLHSVLLFVKKIFRDIISMFIVHKEITKE